jgi:hypothetical protein
MLIAVTAAQSLATLGALRYVATGGGTTTPTAMDLQAIAAFDRFILRRNGAADLTTLHDTSPAELAAAFSGNAFDVRQHVAQFLIVMALVDGAVDQARIATVIEFAQRLDIADDGVRQLAELGRGNLKWVSADAQRQNMLSITGHEVDEPEDQWILPYRARPDAALVERYRALGKLPRATLGRTFFEFYRANGFAFAGDPKAVNEQFATPHDTCHVLSGYDTTPQGELLVSTFTAGLHPREPMSGHILPVIMSWHMGIELIHFAGAVKGQLDPEKFWNAWERGAEVTTDVFAKGWDLFAVVAEPLDSVRATYRVPSLDPALAAHGAVPSWYHPAP